MTDERRGQAGFTLIEILVVVLIITILAAVVGVRVAQRPAEARAVAAAAQIRNFQTALQLYRMEQGRFPTQRQGLQALCIRPQSEPVPERYPEGGYLEAPRVPLDPWGREYVYLLPGPEGYPYEIVSYGGDGEPGGEGEDADVSSVNLQ